MHFRYRNVNSAFQGLVSGLDSGEISYRATPSRYGDVYQIVEPVLITYTHPRERVLLNDARDCNPFFHLYESLWMLAGRRDVEPLAYYNSKMREFSDDGDTYYGAYGHRWRKHFGVDQLTKIVEELKEDPNSRRVVLQIWDAETDLGLEIKTKDKPCNTQAYFAIRCEHNHPESGEGYGMQYLDMTVCNRSNDMVWGMLGANVVHFSFLQEWLANQLEVQVGQYHQFTNNLHVYKERWTPKKWLNRCYPDYPQNTIGLDASLSEIERFVTYHQTNQPHATEPNWESLFLRYVARHMCNAFHYHKARDYASAVDAMKLCGADDWYIAGSDWLSKREYLWEAKNA